MLALHVLVIMFYVVLRGNGDQMPAWMEKLIAPLQCSPLLRPDKFQHSIGQTLIGNRWGPGPSAGSQSWGGSGERSRGAALLCWDTANVSWHFSRPDWHSKCIPEVREAVAMGVPPLRMAVVLLLICVVRPWRNSRCHREGVGNVTSSSVAALTHL